MFLSVPSLLFLANAFPFANNFNSYTTYGTASGIVQYLGLTTNLALEYRNSAITKFNAALNYADNYVNLNASVDFNKGTNSKAVSIHQFLIFHFSMS